MISSMNEWMDLLNFFILRSLSELLIRYNQVNVEIEFLIIYLFLFQLKNWFYLMFFIFLNCVMFNKSTDLDPI